MRFVLEEGDWKILEEQISEGPIDPHSFLPPESGSFLRQGTPWAEISYATKTAELSKDDATRNWEMQAALDESFLYVRLSSETELPAVGTEVKEQGVTGAPAIPNIVVERTSDQTQTDTKTDRFEIFIGDVTTTKFGTKPRHHVNYSMSFKHGDKTIFYCHATSMNRILQVHGKLIDIMIPRAILLLREGHTLQLISTGPVSGFLPYAPTQF